MPGLRQPRCRCRRSALPISSSLLLLSYLLPQSSLAQLVSERPAASSTPNPTPSTSLSPAHVTASPTVPALLASRTQPAVDTSHPVFSDNASRPSDTSNSSSSSKESHDHGLLNYYFFFLAILVVILFFVYWALHRRKKKKVARSRSMGQTALARDLDGWVGNRRWVHGGWRGVVGANPRREEGLDERGEAPPPYQPEGSDLEHGHGGGPLSSDHTSRSVEGLGGEQTSAPEITIPMRTLSRDGHGRRPPGYEEALAPASGAPASDIGSTRPNTALTSYGSTGDLVGRSGEGESHSERREPDSR